MTPQISTRSCFQTVSRDVTNEPGVYHTHTHLSNIKRRTTKITQQPVPTCDLSYEHKTKVIQQYKFPGIDGSTYRIPYTGILTVKTIFLFGLFIDIFTLVISHLHPKNPPFLLKKWSVNPFRRIFFTRKSTDLSYLL